jgi:hypothetical protein
VKAALALMASLAQQLVLPRGAMGLPASGVETDNRFVSGPVCARRDTRQWRFS